MYLEYKWDGAIGTFLLSWFRVLRLNFFRTPLQDGLRLLPLLHWGLSPVPVDQLDEIVFSRSDWRDCVFQSFSWTPGHFSDRHPLLIAHCAASEEIFKPVIGIVLRVHVPARKILCRHSFERYLCITCSTLKGCNLCSSQDPDRGNRPGFHWRPDHSSLVLKCHN